MSNYRTGSSQESDIKRLISQITDFEPEDENFELCLQFSQNHFKYHRFLSVDSHKITKRLDGISTKFAVHSQRDKSDTFKELTENFLKSPLSDQTPQPRTDAHYGILSLLLDLSNCPTDHSFKEKQPHEEVAPEPEFDWTRHLLDGEDKRYYYSYSSEDEEEESEEEIDQPELEVDFLKPESSDALQTHDSTKGWLGRNVVVQYWNNEGREDSAIGRFPSSNLHKNVEKLESSDHPFHVSKNSFITEIQLIREILWMLIGVKENYVFKFDGRRFSLNPDVYISHLTDKCLETYLQKFIIYGNHIVALNTFCEDVITNSCDFNDLTMVTQTYQAFVGTLTHFLKDYQQFLSTEEVKVRDQETAMTLSILHDDLEKWLEKVDIVYSIYITGIAAAAELDSNILKASHLLNVMFKMLIDQDTLGSSDEDKMSLLLVMWVKTFLPYLTILSDWINTGNLIDPREDFLIQRNKTAQSFDETFWEKGFLLRLKSNVDMSSFRVSQDIDISDATTIPKFLKPVLKEIVLTGKSMELLISMGKAETVIRTNSKEFKQKSLYEVFISNLLKMLGTKQASAAENSTSSSATPSPYISPWQLEDQLKVNGVYDPLLEINFAAIFDPVKMSDLLHEGNDDNDLSLLRELELNSLQPLEVILQKCLYPYIQDRYNEVCLELIQIIKNEFCLLQDLKDMRSFFLMEAGDTLFDFYSDLFDRIKRHEEWREESVLSFALQDALESQFARSTNRLTVEVQPPSSENIYPIALTDCIKLHYKVAWPANMIISHKYQSRYNEIFSFILQIKRSKYTMEQLNFKDLERKDILKTFSLSQTEDPLTTEDELSIPDKIHRMQILRFRLMFFVNSLHNYIMTRILHSTGLEFEDNLEKANDLDQIIAAHVNYLQKIYHHCILDQRYVSLKSVITQVLNLTLVFHNQWELGAEEISEKSLVEMETVFSNYVGFLTTFLNTVIKRGTFPHLEFLAFSMTTLMGKT